MIIAVLAGAASLAAAPAADAPASRCPGESTIEINDCQSAVLAKAEDELKRYLDEARKRLKSEAADDAGAAKALSAFDKVQAAWIAYRAADCDALYDYWSAGTIRNTIALTCEIDLTRARTHTVWSEYLTYMDSTPPLLPEPSTASGAPFAN
ncbi:MAG TPA: lysozyme inhibitor LprI family protein [Caulobacteraceae bacterium]|jgi:uncharacterized protein YecT (DUF1311 family)